MRDLIEDQFTCTIRQWAEPTDDFGGEVYSAVQNGRLLVAESLALLISALHEEAHRPLILLAA